MQIVDKDGNVFGPGITVTGPDGKPKTISSGTPIGPAGGDLSGTYPNPSVTWVNGETTYNAKYYPLSTNPAGYLNSLTVGSTAISSGTNGRVLFQNGGVLQQSANLFWDNANGRLGVGTSTPVVQLESVKPLNGFECQIQARNSFSGGGSFGGIGFGVTQATWVNNTGYIGVLRSAVDIPQLIFGVAGTVVSGNLTHERMRINGGTGNILINTTTDAGFRLDVNGTARFGATTVTAPGALSTDLAFKVRNSVNTVDLFNVAGNGRLSHSSNVFTGILTSEFNANNQYVINHSGIGQVWRYGAGNTISTEQNLSGTRGASFGYGVVGVLRALQINAIPVQSSGTTNAIGIDINPIINNTGTYSGITWGLYYRPTLTSLTGTTHRAIETVSGDVIFGSTSGNVGIGQTTPTARLDVRAPGALSTDLALRVRNSANTADLFSIAGNGTAMMQGVLTAAADAIFNGVNIGRGGGGNVNNTRVGELALNANTTGVSNDGFGVSALRFLTTGSNNSGFGISSLRNITTTSGNVGIGADSGRRIADNSNLTLSSNSVFIGYNTRANADNQTNQIVIGYNAIGAGSNTVVLGNDSIVTTALKGNIGIGTTSPAASAKVQIDSTTQGFLPPRMTNAQRTAISSPAVGLMVYCTDLVEGLYVYKSTGWTFVI